MIMANLEEWQILENDIDWYCLVNGRPTHIASMGGMIPEQFRDSEQLWSNQTTVAKIEPFAEVRLNFDAIQNQVSNGYEYLQDQGIRSAVENANREHPGFVFLRSAVENANREHPGFVFLEGDDLAVRLFASTFVEKARRGFRSFARLEGEKGNVYVLIAEPAKPADYYKGTLHLKALECKLDDKGARIII